MSNILKVQEQQAILSLARRGWSRRRIARELGLDRKTVRRYLTRDLAEDSLPSSFSEPDRADLQNPPVPTPGSESGQAENPPVSTPGDLTSSPTHSPAGGRPSLCESFASEIEAKLEKGLSAQRIYQDLVGEVGFGGSYQSVKRFVRQLRASEPDRVWRIETQPSEEAQVDFGTGALILGSDGKRRRPWIFRIVLSYSRKAYSEVVLRQTTELFIRCLENAFRAFGGVTKTLNLDNLKAAVSKADWYDPELNPKLESFCRHYGTALLPCRPYHPEHKGKCENSVGYVKSNALKGRTFSSLAQENLFLAQWERTVADQRIHGTTRKQVAALFAEEKPLLLPLPASLFPCFEEAERTVHRDSYVEVAKAYYEVPQEYIRRSVWVRWDSRCVRIFNQRWDQIQMHTRLAPGQFTNTLGVGGGRGSLEENLAYWLERASEMGQPCAAWAQGLVQQRGHTAIRTLMGLIQLSRIHSFKSINEACADALTHGAWRLREVRQRLNQPSPQIQFRFADSHPLIRNLAEYGLLIRTQHHE